MERFYDITWCRKTDVEFGSSHPAVFLGKGVFKNMQHIYKKTRFFEEHLWVAAFVNFNHFLNSFIFTEVPRKRMKGRHYLVKLRFVLLKEFLCFENIL